MDKFGYVFNNVKFDWGVEADTDLIIQNTILFSGDIYLAGSTYTYKNSVFDLDYIYRQAYITSIGLYMASRSDDL
jgi:hypothetical protein